MQSAKPLGDATRILVLCPFPINTGAGQRLKFEQYYEDWRAAGYEVDVSPFADQQLWEVLFAPGHLATKACGVLNGYARRVRDVFRLHKYDVVYVHQWVTPLGPPLFERLTRRLARRIIFDLEDNLLAARREGGAGPNRLTRMLRGRGKPRLLAEQADHVIASSPALAAECRQLNRHGSATYISSSVNTDRFVPKVDPEGTERLVIGWTGTHSTKPMLDLLRPVFRRLAGEVPFRLRVIGNFDYALPGVDLEVLRWSAEEEVAQLQGVDIGVYPLPLDDRAWVGGKSGLKAIQYMAFGLPLVATNAGNTSAIVRHGENGLLVRAEGEWVAALLQLIRDPALRRRLGEQARKDAVERFSVHVTADRYRQVLSEVMRGRR